MEGPNECQYQDTKSTQNRKNHWRNMICVMCILEMYWGEGQECQWVCSNGLRHSAALYITYLFSVNNSTDAIQKYLFGGITGKVLQ